jgi:hypothetical protein
MLYRQSNGIMVHAQPLIFACGVSAVLQKEDEIRLDNNGCFMRIPETLADKIIAQKPVDVLLDHNKRFRLERSRKFWKETRRVGKNKNENVLMVEYEITNKNFIAALREAAERYSDKLGSEYYSPDGFVPNRPKTGEPTQRGNNGLHNISETFSRALIIAK